jgi:hypothetical protein
MFYCAVYFVLDKQAGGQTMRFDQINHSIPSAKQRSYCGMVVLVVDITTAIAMA